MKNLTPQNRLCDVPTNRLRQLLFNTLESAGPDSDGAKALQRELKQRDRPPPISIEIATAVLCYEKESSAKGLMQGLQLPGPPYQRHHVVLGMFVRRCAAKGCPKQMLIDAANRLREQPDEDVRQTVVLIPDHGSVDLKTIAKTLDEFLDAVAEGGPDDG